MKSKSIILSTLMATLLGMGCGGSPTEPVAPAQPVTPTESPAGGDGATQGLPGDGAGSQGSEGTGEGAAAASDAPSATALGPQITPSGTVRFNFQPQGRVKKIYLAGNFNGWNPSNDEYLLSDEDGDGIYSITIELDPGTYQYKFVVDSRWTKDPNSPGSHPDGFGGQNGKFEVPAQ